MTWRVAMGAGQGPLICRLGPQNLKATAEVAAAQTLAVFYEQWQKLAKEQECYPPRPVFISMKVGLRESTWRPSHLAVITV